MTPDILASLAAVIVVAVLAQWIAWRMRIPSIVLLLMAGFAAGPATQLLDPDALLGDLLIPVVSIAVAIVLFEGGLSLRWQEAKRSFSAIRNLVTVGVVVSWGIATWAGLNILGLELRIAALLGAILVVTGPTVVVPLLRHVRPAGNAGSVLKWEGIVIDPIGAALAVLVFEAILAADSAGPQAATSAVLQALSNTVLIGFGLGLLGAVVILIPIERGWLPEYLHTNLTLMSVIGMFAASNQLQPESGLLTVTLMGIILANREQVNLRYIEEFMERLQILLVPTLFVILAARLDPREILPVPPASLLFVGILVFLARPISVFVSTLGTPLSWRERAFIAWMAPRGIVAAAVASVFALELQHAEMPGAERLVAITFLVIVCTVSLYGLTAGPLARFLGIAQADPQGIFILGAHAWTRDLAAVLQNQGVPVLLGDINRANYLAARAMGLRAYLGDLLGELAMEELDLKGMGYFLAATQNDEINSLAALNMAPLFGEDNVYQLAPARLDRLGVRAQQATTRGCIWHGPGLSYSYVQQRLAEGSVFKATALSETFSYARFLDLYGDQARPLFVWRADGHLQIACAEAQIRPEPGDVVIALVDPLEDAAGS